MSFGGRLRWRLLAALLVACGAFLLVVGAQALRLGAGAHGLDGVFQAGEKPSATVLAEPVEWDEDTAPNYYAVVGKAHVDDDEALEVGDVSYMPLDGLGRAGRVCACVDLGLMEAGSTREREDASSIRPSGWGENEEVDIELPTGDVYHGYFWNRSHLLAKSLGGDEVVENLVCGTRMQNVGTNMRGAEGGMAYPETLARAWLRAHPDGNVRYVVTPRYFGDELVCRVVVVDVRSSDGSLDLEIEVYNAAKGFVIDYADGTFWHE